MIYSLNYFIIIFYSCFEKLLNVERNKKICIFLIQNADTEKELRDTFRIMDKEGEGFITAAALKFVVTKLGIYY